MVFSGIVFDIQPLACKNEYRKRMFGQKMVVVMNNKATKYDLVIEIDMLKSFCVCLKFSKKIISFILLKFDKSKLSTTDFFFQLNDAYGQHVNYVT